MSQAQLLFAVGCPGSGKTYHLNELRAQGKLDAVIPDGLEDQLLWVRAIPEITRRLDDGDRIGICGQTMTKSWNRRFLMESFGSRARFIFFEPDYKACLINVVKATLGGAPHAWHRACCIDAIKRERRYELPNDVTPIPVHSQSVSPDEVEKFFRIVQEQGGKTGHLFDAAGESRLRGLLAE